MAASSDDEGLAELFPDEAEEFARDSEHLAAKLAQANANVESLLIAIESERAARISLEERVDEVRGEAERSRAERNVLEAELAAARSLARGTDSVERSEFASGLLEAAADTRFWMQRSSEEEARAQRAEARAATVARRLEGCCGEIAGLRREAAVLKRSVVSEVEATRAVAVAAVRRAGQLALSERRAREAEGRELRSLLLRMTHEEARAGERVARRRAATGSRAARLAAQTTRAKALGLLSPGFGGGPRTPLGEASRQQGGEAGLPDAAGV